VNIFQQFKNFASVISTEDPKLMLQEEEVIAIDDTHRFKTRPQRAFLKMSNNRWGPVVDLPI
jgi:replication-associated recombination protein RarA